MCIRDSPPTWWWPPSNEQPRSGRRPGRAAREPAGRPLAAGPIARAENVKTTVLLVDDQPLLRAGFRMVLEEEPELSIVGEAEDGAEAVRLTAELAPDVVLMDIRMPGMDGVEATRRIVEQTPESRVLVLTTFDLDEYVFSALRAGASGFVLKDVLPAELARAIQAVANGDAVVAPSVTRRLLDNFLPHLPGPGEPAVANSDARLSTLTDSCLLYTSRCV